MGTTEASSSEWPSWCWRPSPLRVVRPAVQPNRKPRPRHVAQRPQQVAHPLEPEHRIEEVEGDERLAPGGIGGGGGGEGGGGPGLGDALLEDLARCALGVVEGEVGIDRGVALAVGRVDLDLAISDSSPKVRASSETMGTIRSPDRRVADRVRNRRAKRHGGGDRRRAGAGQQVGEGRRGRGRRAAGPDQPAGERTAEGAPALGQVLGRR